VERYYGCEIQMVTLLPGWRHQRGKLGHLRRRARSPLARRVRECLDENC